MRPLRTIRMGAVRGQLPMRSSADTSASAQLHRFANQLRSRGRIQFVLKMAVWALASGLLSLVAAALLSNHIVSPTWAAWAWIATAAGPIVCLALGVRSLRQWDESSAAQAAAKTGWSMGTRLVGALQLDTPRGHQGLHSPDLVHAHLAAVNADLAKTAPSQALPYRRSLSPLPWAILGLAATALIAHPHARIGVAALLKPATRGSNHELTAPLLGSAQARLIFPSYLQRAPEVLRDPATIKAPLGTTVEFSANALHPLDDARLHSPDESVALRLSDAKYSGRFVMRTNGPLRISSVHGGQEFLDSSPRELIITQDRAPDAKVLSPANGSAFPENAKLKVHYSAQDDEGLNNVQLIIELPSGAIQQRALWSQLSPGDATKRLERSEPISLRKLGLRPGDHFSLQLRVQDNDELHGPNTGTSQRVELSILSNAGTLSEHLPLLKTALDHGLVALADRLEGAQKRNSPQHQTMVGATNRFVSSLGHLRDTLTSRQARQNFEADQLDDMHRRLKALLGRESAALKARNDSTASAARANTRLVTELERDLLKIADLLAQAHVKEAQALAAELQELRKRMQQLLTQLSDTDSDLAKSELLAELSRAENRLRELMRSMAEMSTQVPSEFVNEEAVKPKQTKSTMADLRSAIQGDDMDAAAKHLESLENELASLSEQLEQGGLQFRKARFGPSDQARSEAREQLSMLEEEQRRLAGTSADSTRRIMERSTGTVAPDTHALHKQAQDINHQLSQMESTAMGSRDREILDQAKQRVGDAQDALEAGDVGAAARMTSAGERAVDRIAQSLEMDAKMFPGHEGRGQSNAEQARKAANALDRLQRNLEQTLPEISEQATQQDLAGMERGAAAQSRARQRAEELKESLERGPDGLPLAPGTGSALERAQDAMRRAERALRRGDPQTAALSQEDAAEQLKSLGEKLAQQDPQGNGPSQAGEKHGGSQRSASHEKVDIPPENAFIAPKEQRRRLLDAMREASPPGYESAVKQYYQELLR